MQQILILFPFYNDEDSFTLFAAELSSELITLPGYAFTILVVNDGSACFPHINSSIPTTTVHLHRNLGHQKAIAIGLAYAHHNLKFDKVIIMDCDGEDNPRDVKKLLNASFVNNKIIFAQRTSRQEGRSFKFYYSIYKALFRLLTGRSISFGNFMLIPKYEVDRIVYYSEIWNHLAGGILKSKSPFEVVATHRSKRLAGTSKMSFTLLLLHGLGAIGVFIDVIALRLLVLSLIMILLALFAIIVIVFIKYFTHLAMPGWTTTAVSSMLILLLQSFLLSLFTLFLYLSAQGQRKFIPAHHYSEYVRNIEKVYTDDVSISRK